MNTYVSTLEDELTYLQEIFQSVPFDSDKKTVPFLRVYQLSHEELIRLNCEPYKFPIEGSKLLKFGISLGNILKTLEIEKDIYHRQQVQQNVFLKNLNKSQANKSRRHPILPPKSEYDPFNGSSSQLKRESDSSEGSMTVSPLPYQVRFMVNLLNVLKSFDIRPHKEDPFKFNSSAINHIRGDSLGKIESVPLNGTPGSKTTRPDSYSSITSRTDSSKPSSPIKLSSRQLSIEKLEINIDVDSIFIYKTVLRILGQVFTILKEHMESLGISLDSLPKNDLDEDYSIFSSNSMNSQDSTYLGNDEYLRVFHQVKKRINRGILEPFVTMLYQELAENQIQDSFNSLIENL